MSLDTLIRDVQARLGLTVDGKPGPMTWTAIHDHICGAYPVTATANPPAQAILVGSAVDERSEKNIATLHPRVQPYARSLVQQAAAAGITIKITDGIRTYAEQDEIYKQGRTKPGKKVTNATGGYSNHNFGLAFDIAVFEGDKWLPESPKYKALAPIGMALGLTWGGNWETPVDQPHYELRPPWAKAMPENVMLAELRRRKAAGRDFFA